MENVTSDGVSEYGGVKLCHLVGRLGSMLRAYQCREGDINWLSEEGDFGRRHFGMCTYSEESLPPAELDFSPGDGDTAILALVTWP